METSAFAILTKMTLKVAVQIVRQDGLNFGEDHVDKLTEALKTTLKSNIAKVQKEWKEALDANLGDVWLKELMETQAVEIAQETIETIKSLQS